MIKLTIDWWKLCAMAKGKPDDYELLRKIKPEMPELKEALESKGWYNFEAFVNDPSDLPEFMYASATWEPIRPLKLMVDGRISSTAVAQALAVAQVHLPGNELLRIREVLAKEDCCTETLQECLNAGWKIIAVCPQPSRRPDYILGKGIEG